MPVLDDMAGIRVARIAAIAGVLAAIVAALLLVPADARRWITGPSPDRPQPERTNRTC